jgi:molybdenum cofactor cytidylyltransferase
VQLDHIACLVLAAGCSSRMQGPNKLLLRVGGESLVRRTVREASSLDLSEIVVVTGFDSERVSAEVASLPLVSTAHNPDHFTGMHSSIRVGIQNLRHPCDAFFVCLSDQPLFNRRTLVKLASEFEDRSHILYPTYLGQRGHPVLIGSDYISEILREPDGDYGCSYLFRRYPDSVRSVAMAQLGVITDIDEPKDYLVYG